MPHLNTSVKTRIVCMLLSVLILAGICCIPVGSVPSEDGILSTSDSRFFSSTVAYSGMSLLDQSPDALTLRILTTRAYLSFNDLRTCSYKANALRLVLGNDTSSQKLTVIYTLKNGDTGETSLTLESYSQAMSYTVHLPDADQLKSFTMQWEGGLSGTLVLYSVQPVSVSPEPVASCGDISVCRYDPDFGTVTVQGYVTIRTASAHTDSRIALFILDYSQRMEDLLKDTEIAPVASIEIRNSFSFTVPAPALEDRLCMAGVCIIDPDGTRIPVTEAQVIRLYSESIPSPDFPSSAFKGATLDSVSDMIGIHAGSTILDVDLEQLFNSQNGEPYSFDSYTFFFSRPYLQELQSRYTACLLTGSRIYLRLRLQDGSTLDLDKIASAAYAGEDRPVKTRSLTDPETPGNLYRTLYADTPEARVSIYALTRYLCETFSGISGLILGTGMNAPARNSVPMSEYAQRLAETLVLIENTAHSIRLSLQIVIPVYAFRQTDLIPESLLNGKDRYQTDLFLNSLFRTVRSITRNNPRYTLMFCTDISPYGLRDQDFPLKTPISDMEEGDRLSAISSEGMEELFASLTGSGLLSDSYLVEWTPGSGNTGISQPALYALSYFTLFGAPHAATYFLTLYGNTSAAIRSVLTFMDTDRSREACSAYLDVLGYSSWDEVIPEQLSDKSFTRSLYLYTPPLTASEINTVGSYVTWNFTTALSTRGWLAGPNCTKISLGSNSISPRSLMATMHFAEGEPRAFLLASGSSESSLVAADYLKISGGISGGEGTYQILATLISNTYYLTSSITVTAGERFDLIMDVSRASSEASSVWIAVEPVDSGTDATLCLDTISALSKTMDSDSLAQFINSYASEPAKDSGTNPAVILIVVSFVLIWASIFVFLLFKRREK